MSLPPLMSYSDVSSPLGTGCCVFWCFPCAYGMLVDMRMENKVLQDTQDSVLSIVFASPFLSSCPSDHVAGGRKLPLRQLRPLLRGVLLQELLWVACPPRREHVRLGHQCNLYIWRHDRHDRLRSPTLLPNRHYHRRRGLWVHDVLRHLRQPHLNPQQAQPKGARHLSV